MFYPQNIIEDVRNSVDIVDVVASYVSITPSGSNYFGLCPFHNEKTPSFSVSRNKQIFHCFGCGASGNVFTFLMQIDRLDFVESVQAVAERIGYSLPENSRGGSNSFSIEQKNNLLEIHKKVARYYYDNLMSGCGEIAQNYLKERSVSLNMIKKFGLGYTGDDRNGVFKFLMEEGYDVELAVKSGLVIKGNDNSYFDRFSRRLMFPIFDPQNRVIAFGGRSLSDNKKEAKYLNSPETIIFDKSKNLYGINFTKNSKDKSIILVEGYMDVISLFQFGFNNAVAALGTSFNENHARNIRKYTSNVSLLFDSDDAGVKASLRAIPVLVKHGLNVKVVNLGDEKDPDEFLKNHGEQLFQSKLDSSDNYIDFLINVEKSKFDITNVSEKIQFTMEVAKIISKLTNEVEKDAYIKSVAVMTGIDEEAIKSDVNKLCNKQKEPVLVKKSYSNTTSEKKAVLDAKKSLITIILKNKNISKIIENNMEVEEMNNSVYEKLLSLIFSFHNEDKIVCEADTINFFETIDEQKSVSEIFSTSIEFDNMEIMEKVINDLVKTIKKSYLDIRAAKSTKIEDLQDIINQRKKIDTLHISIN